MKKTLEKTARKEKKALKKELGEDDIDSILQDIAAKDAAQVAVTVTVCPAPAARSSATFVSSPTKPELILFGGESYDGRVTRVFNELYVYNTAKQEWRSVRSPNTPPPRSAHQAVVVPRGGGEGQMFVFGGEFTSPSGEQFHHYKDLWVLHLGEMKWEQIQRKGGPSARSGHRMIVHKNKLVLFGGFHDSGRDIKYFNDVHVFDLDAMEWEKIPAITSSLMPCARSGFVMFSNETANSIYIYGGFCTESVSKKKEVVVKGKPTSSGLLSKNVTVDEPRTLNDLWCLNLNNFTYTPVKRKGVFPSLRSCMSGTQWREKNRGFMFGGIADQTKGKKSDENEEDDEDVSQHFNDLLTFDVDKQQFYLSNIKASNLVTEYESALKQKSKEKEKDGGKKDEKDETDETATESDSIFDFNPVRDVFPALASASSTKDTTATPTSSASYPPAPSARRSAHITYKSPYLYLYGGVEEREKGREVTYNDLWCCDLQSEWKCIEAGSAASEWYASDNEAEESGEEDEKEEEKGESESEEGSDEDASEDEGECGGDPLVPAEDENLNAFFNRTKEHWMSEATKVVHAQGGAEKEIRKQAFELASAKFQSHQG